MGYYTIFFDAFLHVYAREKPVILPTIHYERSQDDFQDGDAKSKKGECE